MRWWEVVLRCLCWVVVMCLGVKNAMDKRVGGFMILDRYIWFASIILNLVPQFILNTILVQESISEFWKYDYSTIVHCWVKPASKSCFPKRISSSRGGPCSGSILNFGYFSVENRYMKLKPTTLQGHFGSISVSRPSRRLPSKTHTSHATTLSSTGLLALCPGCFGLVPVGKIKTHITGLMIKILWRFVKQ